LIQQRGVIKHTVSISFIQSFVVFTMNFKDCDNESLSHGQIKFQRIIIF